MAFLFSIQDFDRTLDSTYSQPLLQVLVDFAGEYGALVPFSLIMICV
ncbi:polyamine transporter tpo5 [Madurella fahalii]|uniref:Polyamine transporter tpo5 n=1 Tax=Madurella fahalii TaxID=1157608 RepID=A0ABQ0G7B8_9PEZI